MNIKIMFIPFLIKLTLNYYFNFWNIIIVGQFSTASKATENSLTFVRSHKAGATPVKFLHHKNIYKNCDINIAIKKTLWNFY